MAKYLVQHRRGTAAQWSEKNTIIPREGEIVIEIDEANSLHKLKIGDGVHTYAELAYLMAGDEIITQVLAQAKPRVVTVELTSTWTQGDDNKYNQILTLDGITEHSRLDLQPTADMLAEFKQLGLVFVTENNGGVITVYSVGNMPLKAYTMQATIIETECDGQNTPVIGIPVGSPATQPDWNQSDENSVGFIKNKPTLGDLATKDKVAKTDLATDVQTSLGKADSALQSYTETDPTVPEWAKEATKPKYTADEVGAVSYTAQTLTEEQKAQARTNIGAGASAFSGSYDDLTNKPTIPTSLSDLSDDVTHRTVSDSEKATWNAKSTFTGSYNDLTDIPSTFEPATHTHNYIPTEQKGASGGVAELDATGKVPSAQLPSYVDDVIEYSGLSSFPATGETGKIYVATSTNITYRWSGSSYVAIGSDLALGETSSTAYYGDKGKIAYEHSQSTGNPHGLTASDIGLGNVDNVKQYSVSNPPPYPVTKVNNKTGDVTLAASDVGADASGTASSAVTAHNTNTSAHADIREAINQLSSEIVDKQPAGEYVKSVNGATPDGNGNVAIQVEAEQIPIVDSIDEMTDTSKRYVLKSTGTIHQYKESTYEETITVTDEIKGTDDNPYSLNSRFSSSGTPSTQSGYTITPYIDLTKAEYQGKTIQIHLDGNRYATETQENYIMCATFDTAKNVIIARIYTKLDQSGNSLLAGFDNAGMTLEIHSTTSATLTFTVPLVGDDSKTVGYMRFCGLGNVTDSVYITYQDTRTITEKTWVDTGVSFGGSGIDEETLAEIAKISVLNNEGASPSTVKLLTAPVLDFYNAAAYSDSDYSYSHLEKITYPYRADIPVPFTVKWEYNENAMRTEVAVDIKAIGTLNRFTMLTYNATGLNKLPIYNLLPNKTYYYRVTHIFADGSITVAKSGSFTTSNEPIRLIYVDGTQNVRDLGGWTGAGGKTVKYGTLIRGAALNDSVFIATAKGRRALVDVGILAELNLGSAETSTMINANVTFKNIGYSSYATAITDETRRAQFKEALEWIVEQLTAAKPIYMHCQGGCDRIGTLAFQLLGLLGVSESDLAKEYELSSFSDVGFGRLRTTTKAINTYDYVGMVEALKTYSGDTITDKFVSFATACGVTSDTITSFRSLMLE